MGLLENLYSISSIKEEIKTAIESKGVDMTGLSFADYPGAISSIQTGGNYSQLYVTENGTYYPDGSEEDAFDEVVVLVEPSLQSKTVSVNGTVTPDQGYYGLSAVVVDVPQSVTGYTEKQITEKTLNIVNLSNSASFVGGYAFYMNSSIVTVDLPNCLQLGNSWTTNYSVFASCSKLQTVNLPVCFYINDGAFEYCRNLSYISIPVCQYINAKAFKDCQSLSSLDLSVCVSIGNSAFQNCTSLSQISLPECVSVGSYAFQNCTSLSQIILPKCVNIGGSCFGNTILESLTLLSTSVCTLANTAAFTGTPIASGTGSIYVPANLVSDYQTATRWSNYASQIFSIPE